MNPLTVGPDNGADLVIWGNVESSITIIAASIPVLRALFAEVRQATGRSSACKPPRPPSCVIRHSKMPMSSATLTAPDRDLEAASLSRKSRDSLADLEAPVGRTSLEKRQHKFYADRTVVIETRIENRERRQGAWPAGLN
jgi:hypothetical protein